MIEKTQKNTPEKRQEMARAGARSAFGYLTPLRKKLNAPRGRVFEIIAESKAISGVFTQIKLFLKFCGKRWFKGPLKGGLKKFSKSALRSLTCFLKKRQKGRFYHVQMV